ncbi:MAG TPA: 16S rRNA (cytosine(1402)-N(4))-methyltransferase RsmH, partial [Gaiellaceae bacterium]|nr:16S rRNA (cytosine(1402)-N(4))-methyltransferase RsmH [Gaiellaceae bacterium]
MQRSASDHVPVLADEVRELLAVQPGETVVDATFGAGGHSRLLADDLRGEGKLIAIDRDPTARAYFDRFKAASGGIQARFLRGEFSLVLSQLAANDVQADAILLDLGVSSMQLDRPERGFSYAADAPLDMRMDSSAELSARELVNEADERELSLIFKRFGEERYARQIARAIVR